MLRPVLAGSLVAAALAVAVPSAVARPDAPPPSDAGFPLEQYLRDVLKGRFFVGGAPAALVGARTKDTVTLVGGKAHFQPQLALRRAGRDDGKGRFLVLRSRSYGSALAYVVKLNPGIVRFFKLAFPKAIGGTRFPPMYARLGYAFEVAPDAASPQFAAVGAASAPHPDRALTRRGVALVTLKKGLTPGNYLVRITTAADCCFTASGGRHPLDRLYDAFGTANDTIGWIKLALGPAEAVLELAVETALEKLVDAAADGNAVAQQALRTRAQKEQFHVKRLENAVTAAVTRSELIAKLTVPTRVPDVRGLTQTAAQARLQAHFLRFSWLTEPTREPELVGTVKSQSIAPGQKRVVGTRVTVRYYVPAAIVPPPPPAGVVPFAAPKVVDRIKSLGFPYEPFNVVACDPRVTGSCDPRNAASTLRQSARAFCLLRGTTATPSAANTGRRIGGQEAPYRGESPANPGATRITTAGERWVVVAGQFSGFVGYTQPATVFATVNCLR